MRIKVFQEGVRLSHGRTIQHGALRSNDRQIFVFLNGDHNSVIGFAENLQRDDDGWVSYDITFRQDFLERFKRTSNKITDWFDFSAWASECSKLEDGEELITSGVIKAIYAIPLPGYPRNITNMNNRFDLPTGAVTENVDYVKIAKDELVKYINEKAEKTDGFVINTSYLYVVWFSKTLQNWKALISTSLPDGMYYELTYSGDKKQLYIDAYKKFDNVAVDL